jgi:hypothetical protein
LAPAINRKVRFHQDSIVKGSIDTARHHRVAGAQKSCVSGALRPRGRDRLVSVRRRRTSVHVFSRAGFRPALMIILQQQHIKDTADASTLALDYSPVVPAMTDLKISMSLHLLRPRVEIAHPWTPQPTPKPNMIHPTIMMPSEVTRKIHLKPSYPALGLFKILSLTFTSSSSLSESTSEDNVSP